ncbi:hypothetical protein [Apibacter adventoris]|uniref:Uncharacterized protein n=1 Tax=Apibacter adventoris TaxID=1679466 RepID=A0A2S8AFG1_9FLAO|nr:hypothetical protein [Apibacter adventoris]PQL94856.1 hypothetical protein C4S77_02415 [Apibacter adventoris]
MILNQCGHYRILPSWERSTFHLNGNTYQTYIWTETMNEVIQKGEFIYTPELKVKMQQGQQGFSKW